MTAQGVPWYSLGMQQHFLFLVAFGLLTCNVTFGQEPDPSSATAPVLRMYKTYCATCHGTNGDAAGVASRFVFPKPRDFRNSAFRWVTTDNFVANKDDVVASITRGIPGSSMQSWESLGSDKISQLADLVLQMRDSGIRDKVKALLIFDGFEDADTGNLNPEGTTLLNEITSEKTVPGAVRTIDLQPLGIDERKESTAKGKELFVKMSCVKCHGERGEGSFKMDLFDDRGFPTFATDFKRDPIKSSTDSDMARVILYGLPGASMPSSKMSNGDVRDLISYIRSLAASEPQYLTNIQRYYRAIGFRRR